MSESPGHAESMIPEQGSMAARLLPLVYAELRALASTYLQSNPNHTLQPTALVHEAYIKLARGEGEWLERDHFLATAATAMRQILVDYARRKQSQKRGGSRKQAEVSVELMAEDSAVTGRDLRVLELDELLVKLAKADPRAAKISELRLFGGMDQQQIADVLGVSRSTVQNDWTFAKAWLKSQAEGNDR